MTLEGCLEYKPPPLFKSGHLQSIFPSIFRRGTQGIHYARERIELPDGDFIDVDCSLVRGDKAVIVCHGLEGSSQSGYMKGMVRAFNRRGWDAVAVNYRGCSGEPNKLLRSYHSGNTEDLESVVNHVVETHQYTQLALIGFSLGGNIVLKYLGEHGADICSSIKGAAVISATCDLEACARRLAEPANSLYMRLFTRRLKKKLRQKMRTMDHDIDPATLDAVRTFEDFDNVYTAPIHGFLDAQDYWAKCSGRQFIPGIRVPTLLVSALDDPFLAPECFPFKEEKGNKYFTLETPQSGGHVGFVTFGHKGEYWHERRVALFLASIIAQ